MIITIHIKLIREHCEIVGEKLRLVFSITVNCDQELFLFLAGVKISDQKKSPDGRLL